VIKKLAIFTLTSVVLTLGGCSTVVQKQNQANTAIVNHDLQTALNSNMPGGKAGGKNAGAGVNSMVSQLTPSVDDMMKKRANEKRLNVSVNGVSAKEFFLRLGQNLPISILVSPKVKGKITLSLKNVTLHQIFDALSNLYDYDFVKTSYGYLVTPLQYQLKVYHINKLDLERSGTNVTTINGIGLGGGGVKVGEAVSDKGAASVSSEYSNKDFWKDLRKSLQLIMTSATAKSAKGTPKLTINPETGTIVVNAYESTQIKIAKFLHTTQLIDEREVVIEAKLLEITLNREFSSGIDWSYIHASYNGSTGVITYKADKATKQPFAFTLTALAKQGKVTVLSSPRVTTMNNQQALIKVGTDRYYVTEASATTTPIGETASEGADVTFTPFFSGIALDVLPEISGDGFITLHIHPMVSRIEEEVRKVTVSSTQKMELPMAKGTLREADEVVRAKDGQIVILGGLMDSYASASGSTVPGMDLVKAYPNRTDTGDVTELIILLRATIQDSDSTWVDQFKQMQNQVRTVGYFNKQHNFF
jgi:MSHA biogenesis protein MshL